MHDVTLRRLQMFYYAISNRRSSYQPLLFACRVSASYQQSINALRDRSIITSRFFLYFLTPSPLSLVVTLLTTPSENYVTLIQPPKHEKNVWIRIRFLSQSILLHWTDFAHQLLVSPRWWQVVRCADHLEEWFQLVHCQWTAQHLQ